MVSGVTPTRADTPVRSAVRRGFLAAGAGVGLWVALPVQVPPREACPPAGEGLVACQLVGWQSSLTVLALILLVSHLMARALLDWAPRLARAVWPATATPTVGPISPALSDPLLVAACWGDVGASRRPDSLAVDTAAAQWREARRPSQPSGLARLEGRITWPATPDADEPPSRPEATTSRSLSTASIRCQPNPVPTGGFRRTGRPGSTTRLTRALVRGGRA